MENTILFGILKYFKKVFWTISKYLSKNTFLQRMSPDLHFFS